MGIIKATVGAVLYAVVFGLLLVGGVVLRIIGLFKR
jgi:hypothetical protein